MAVRRKANPATSYLLTAAVAYQDVTEEYERAVILRDAAIVELDRLAAYVIEVGNQRWDCRDKLTTAALAVA